MLLQKFLENEFLQDNHSAYIVAKKTKNVSRYECKRKTKTYGICKSTNWNHKISKNGKK